MERNQGERPRILFDEIDTKIIKSLKKKKKGVMELVNELNIKHKNLKAHLDKLVKNKILFKEEVPKSRLILFSCNTNTIIKQEKGQIGNFKFKYDSKNKEKTYAEILLEIFDRQD